MSDRYIFHIFIRLYTLFPNLNRYLQMNHSPQFSESSFRDYYQHTSQRTSFAPQGQTYYLANGIKNFKLLKMFIKINNKMESLQYWNLFISFKKIALVLNQQDKLEGRQMKLKILLNKHQNLIKNSDISVVTQRFIDNMQRSRQIEVKKLLFFSIKFINNNYLNLNRTIRALQVYKQIKKRQQNFPSPSIKVQIIRLSKATLCIFTRSIICKYYKIIFNRITYPRTKRSLSIEQVSNKFSKHKKQGNVYYHKSDKKKIKLISTIQLFTFLAKKFHAITKNSFISICLSQERQEKQSSKNDNQQIFPEIVKHMIYLARVKSQKPAKQPIHCLKTFKLVYLLNKAKRNEKKSLRMSLLKWRKSTTDKILMIRAQISRLRELKQHYIEQL